jgi:hypothetical protein
MNRKSTTVASAVLGVATIAALPAGAFAAHQSAAAAAITRATKQLQKQANGRAIVFGTLTATGTNSATVNTPHNGSITVTLAPKARLVGRSQAAATQGYKSGEQVLVSGVYHNGFVGSNVAYDSAAFPIPVISRVAGTVSTSSAQSVTVAQPGGKSTEFLVNSVTRYFVNGAAAKTAPALTANEKIIVLGQEQTDGSFLARIVAVGALQGKKQAAVRSAGTITAVAADNASFTLILKSGKTATVTVSAATKFRVKGLPVTAAPTLVANDQVVVQGARSTSTSGAVTIAAKLINVTASA